MNPIFSRTLKALCTIVVAGVLAACGSGSTVDPFKPTRVIGLGDGYNDLTATVRETGSTTGTVVGQVATYFGQTNVLHKAVKEALIDGSNSVVDGLNEQIDSVISANGGFSSGDLVVITVGTFDVKARANATTTAASLVTQIQRILNAGGTHVLVMPVLELSRTPWGRADNFSTTATNDFNEAVNSAISVAFGGRSPNRVIYANISGVTSEFLKATDSTASYPTFDNSRYDGSTACGNLLFAGCDASGPGVSTSYTTMLFADGIHLTPAGNRWIAQYLYAATAQGWR